MKSAQNVIAVVERLGSDGPLGLSELARRTGIAKSTVQRCLDTLEGAGWIEPAADPESGARSAWAVTDRVGALAPARPVDLVEIARPIAAQVSRRTGEAVHLVGLDGIDVVLLDRQEGTGPIQVVMPVGTRVPAYAAATGKAMLATLASDEVDAHLPPRLRSLTASTITNRSALAEELAAIRHRGWASNQGEWEPSIVAVAAPIHIERVNPVDGSERRVLGALSVSATPQRLPEPRLDDVGREVVRAARQISGLVRARWPLHV